MELLLPALCGLLIAGGVFLLLSRALIRVIVGLSFVAYGVNLAILVAGGGTVQLAPPLLNEAGPYADPLPQALILTAIVIGFGTTALLLVLAVRAYQVTGTDHVQELTEHADPVVPPRIYADPEHPSVSPEMGPPRPRTEAVAADEPDDRSDEASPETSETSETSGSGSADEDERP